MAVTECYIEGSPAFAVSGSAPATQQVIWHYRDTDKIAAETALTRAQAVVAAGLNEPVPAKGSALDLTIAGQNLLNSNIFAMDFVAEKKPPTDSCFAITVTYRPPVVGMDEIPSQVNLPPESRAPEAWLEHIDTQDSFNDGYLISGYDDTTDPISFTEAADRELLANSAGQAYGERMHITQNCVLVIEYNTTNRAEAWRLTRQFRNTVNKDDLQVIPMSAITTDVNLKMQVRKHSMRFLRAEQSRFYDRGWAVSTVQVRFECATEPFHEVLPNIGDYYRTEPSTGTFSYHVERGDTGLMVSPPYQLDAAGGLVKTPTAAEIENYKRRFRALEEAQYKNETWFTDIT